MDRITLEALSRENMDIAAALMDRLVGKGLYTRADLENILSDPEAFFYLVRREGRFLGYFYCFLCTCREARAKTDMDLPALLEPDAKLGVCKSIGLDGTLRGAGLSDQLLNHFTQLLFAAGARRVLVPAWVKDGYVPAGRHLQRCGFRSLGIIRRPWHHIATLECPYCGAARCICDGAIYFKDREDTEP